MNRFIRDKSQQRYHKSNKRLNRELSEKYNLKIEEDYSDSKLIQYVKELLKSLPRMDDILLNGNWFISSKFCFVKVDP